MKSIDELPRAPTPGGTLGHAGSGASKRTRPGVGVQAGPDAPMQHEHCEQSNPYTLHDAMAEYGFPVPLWAIYRANTVTGEQARLLAQPRTARAVEGTVEAPALIKRIADEEPGELPAPCAAWAAAAAGAAPGWVWLRAVPVERAMAAALRMARSTGLPGRVGRLSDLAALCRQAPLYGEKSREAVVRSWASSGVLTLALSTGDRLDGTALEALLGLLRQRRDAMLPTVIAADAAGASILAGAGHPKGDAALCKEVAAVVNSGLTGFTPGGRRAPLVIDLDKPEETKPTEKENNHAE